MDDPWGSPWAEEEQYHQPIKLHAKGNDGASGATQNPAKAATTLAVKKETNSPWDNDGDEDDDDGFGEWASEPVNAAGEGNMDFDSPDEGWQKNAGGNRELIDDRARELPPVWKENTVFTSPLRLAPSPMPKHSIRQPSPDPWATEFTLNHVKSKGNEEMNEETTEEEEEDTKEESGEFERDNGGAHHAILDGRASLPTSSEQSDSGHSAREQSPPAEEEDAASHEVNTKEAKETKRNSTTEAERLSSRRSSAPSDVSRHDDWPHESPRTSMDEDPKRPQVPRKVSTKIQELVEHFDGLAKQEDEEAQTTHRQRNGSEGRTESLGESVDSVDSDEEKSDAEERPVESSRILESPNPVKQDSSPMIDVPTPKSPHTPQTLKSPHRTPKESYGPIEVDIDLSILEKLFVNEKFTPEEDIFIPDVVPHDSFSSTEERKTWYRISRYGTMLKHNSGDDESYVRVTWEKSTMRADTLKIVARWMEEDRLSGQVVLGGGGKTSTLFGWGDVKTAPLSLSSAFASKESEKKPKTFPAVPLNGFDAINTHASSSAPPKTSIMPLQGLETITPVSSSPVAKFGWNSLPDSKPGGSHPIPPASITTQIIPPPTVDPPSPIRVSTSSLRPIPISETIKPTESPQRTPVLASEMDSEFLSHGLMNQRHAITQIDSADTQDDDDDGWGDMVSSPNVISPPFFPSHNETLLNPQNISEVIKNPPFSSLSSQSSTTIPSHGQQSLFEMDQPITTPSSATTDPSRTAISTPPIAMDSWASADFSFFDSSPAPPTKPVPVSVPLSNPTSLKAVSFSSLPQPQASRPNQKEREEAEQERIVQGVIKNLPDLSYMLRR